MARATRRIEWRRNREEERNDEEDSREPSDLWTRRRRHLRHLTLRTSPEPQPKHAKSTDTTNTHTVESRKQFSNQPLPHSSGPWLDTLLQREREGGLYDHKHYLIITTTFTISHLISIPLSLLFTSFRPNRVHLLLLLHVGFDPRAFGQGQPRKSSKPPRGA